MIESEAASLQLAASDLLPSHYQELKFYTKNQKFSCIFHFHECMTKIKQHKKKLQDGSVSDPTGSKYFYYATLTKCHIRDVTDRKAKKKK